MNLEKIKQQFMSLRIVFMGTPAFAVPSLKILLENGYEVVGVITATDKYGGRGNKKLIESAVKKYALEKGLNILQPAKFKDSAFLERLKALNADLQVVVAFRMLPEVVWDMPRLGTFNLHGSLLPKYRGAAPINWAIINGEKETGATTFFIQHTIDTGDVLFQDKIPIGENDTAGDIHDRMMAMGAQLVLKTVKAIETNNYNLKKQENQLASKAPKIYYETCEINFNQSAQKVHDFIRGMSPYPAAWTMVDGKVFKILRSTIEIADHNFPPGKIISDNKRILKFAVLDGFVQVHELQMQGKKRMNIKDFLNGYDLKLS